MTNVRIAINNPILGDITYEVETRIVHNDDETNKHQVRAMLDDVVTAVCRAYDIEERP